MSLPAEVALLAASALHLGFQATVTAVVYPALADVSADRFAGAHAAHSRRIVGVVGVVYVVLAAACLIVLLAGPRTPATLLSVLAAAVGAGVTAAVAAPTHGRLGRLGRRPELVRRLLVADRIRCVAALLGALAALVSIL